MTQNGNKIDNSGVMMELELEPKVGNVQGQGVPFETLHKAAQSGDAEAQYEIGLNYYNKDSSPQTDRLAAAYWRKAAEQGHVLSQNGLGYLYETGRGVKKDPKMAVQWYEKAASHGCVLAQISMGMCYEEGKGVPQDLVAAAKYYQLAAKQGSDDAVTLLAECKERKSGKARKGSGMDRGDYMWSNSAFIRRIAIPFIFLFGAMFYIIGFNARSTHMDIVEHGRVASAQVLRMERHSRPPDRYKAQIEFDAADGQRVKAYIRVPDYLGEEMWKGGVSTVTIKYLPGSPRDAELIDDDGSSPLFYYFMGTCILAWGGYELWRRLRAR